jgi:hypothetical protein
MFQYYWEITMSRKNPKAYEEWGTLAFSLALARDEFVGLTIRLATKERGSTLLIDVLYLLDEKSRSGDSYAQYEDALRRGLAEFKRLYEIHCENMDMYN